MKKSIFLIWISIFVLMPLLAGCGAAKDGTNITISDIGNVEGTVTDSSNSAALSGVTIQIGDKTATTGATGTYLITDLAVGSRTTTATKTGYQNYNGTMTVTKGTTVTHNIQMTLTGAGDTTPPTVSSTDPANNATAVAVNKAITVTFSEAMDCSTITTSSFTLKDNLSAAVAGTISSCNSTTAVFMPSSSLAYSTTYTASIAIGVKDLVGNAIASEYTWSFTTVAGSSAPHLMGGAIQGVPLNLTNTVTTFAGSTGISGSADGTGISATFNYPHSITTDGTNIYVADTFNYTIRKVAISSGVVTTIAGSAGLSGSTDGTGSSARFSNIDGISTDGTNLYVADMGNKVIRQISISTGAVTTIAGSAGSSGSNDGIGSAARFNNPIDITTDGTNLYIVDFGDHTIRKVVISTGVVTTLAGSAGQSGSADGTGLAARFKSPYGITTDGTNLFIADYNSVVRKVVISTGAVTTIAGSAGLVGTTDGTGSAARFSNKLGKITTDGTNLFLADGGNGTIRKIEISTGIVTTIAGTPGVFVPADGVGSAATFNGPEGMTTDGTNLFVTDCWYHIIRKIQ